MHTPHFGLRCVKVVALGVIDAARAHDFYGHTLGLEPAFEREQQIGYRLGDSVLMLKDDGSIPPTDRPDPRITLETTDARETEAELRAAHVRIADPVQPYDGYFVGSFLDSEGNKLWFCADH